jgi:hypothetical protein
LVQSSSFPVPLTTSCVRLIKLFQPCRGRIGVLGFVEALDQFRRQPRTFVSGQFQKLGENFATVRHRKRS